MWSALLFCYGHLSLCFHLDPFDTAIGLHHMPVTNSNIILLLLTFSPGVCLLHTVHNEYNKNLQEVKTAGKVKY